ncbi:MAG: hypothetical protein KJO15_08860 [Alphaproteobacteria bacterium]|nr:hypothetical protein [Alphaproteobacteria bacterium]
MLATLIVTTLLETLGLGPRPMTCSFVTTGPGDAAIEVVLHPRPSLKDTPGRYRVEMVVNDSLKLPASAQPIATTKGRDIMVRGVDRKDVFYTIGVDEQGNAALNVLWTKPVASAPREVTRVGTCRNHKRYIDQWLTM